MLGDCQPLACRNVALTTDNLTAWHNQLTKIAGALTAGDMLAPYVRDRLHARRQQIHRLLDQTRDDT